MSNQLIYLACPYSHDDPQVRQKRFESATKVAATLTKAGHHVYSPITVGHTLCQYADVPCDWEFWEANDRIYLSISKAVFVLMLPGWETSTGVQAEIKIADDMGLPVEYIDE